MKEVDLLEFEDFYEDNLRTYKEEGYIKNPIYLIKSTSEIPTVCYHEGLEYNEELAIARAYNLVDLKHDGGCVITGKGDYMIGSFTRDLDKFVEQVVNRFYREVKDIIPNDIEVKEDRNDLLVGGKKISGSMAIDFIDEYKFVGFFVSYKNSKEIIEDICTKPMVKEPSGLEEFGVNNLELFRLLEKIIVEYEDDLR